jgi:membrane protease YdiL (CAAX protease family)
MQNLNSNKLANIFLAAAIIFAILAIAMGIVHSQYSDPESSTPAPYIGFLAFILGTTSLIFYRRAKKQNLQTNKWAYRIAGIVILAIVIYVIIGIISLVHCASSTSCQIFAP